MHFINTVRKEDADDKLLEVYATLEGMFGGMVPSIFVSQSLIPEVLETIVLFIKKLMFTNRELSRFQKELIAAYVSKINHCPY